MGKSLLPSHFAVNPKCAKKIKPQKHMKEKKGLTLLLRVGRGRGAVHGASQRGEGAGVLSMVPGRVGRGQVYCPQCLAEGDGAGVLWPGCLSEWGKGRGAVYTVPLQVEAGRGPVHGTSQSGRAWGTVSTVPLTVGGGYCVHSTSHSGRAQGCFIHSTSHSGRAQGCFVHSTSHNGGVYCVHSTSHSGRGGVLCPQYLSQWEGWGTVSTVPHSGGGCCVHSIPQ